MTDKAQNPSATQFLELSTAIANETCRYLENGKLTKRSLQELIKQKTTVKEIARRNAHDLLQLVPNELMIKKDLIERFYLEVFDHKVDLAKVVFLEKKGFTAYCYNTRQFNVDQIMAAYAKKWDTDLYKYMDPAAKKIKHQQKRPKGPYAFAHRGTDEPDAEHLNRSFDDAIAAGFPFANAEEYLLMTGLHKFAKSYFMDRKGRTRTSSLWSVGYLVGGRWFGAYAGLCLDFGYRVGRDPGYGPRELFLSS